MDTPISFSALAITATTAVTPSTTTTVFRQAVVLFAAAIWLLYHVHSIVVQHPLFLSHPSMRRLLLLLVSDLPSLEAMTVFICTFIVIVGTAITRILFQLSVSERRHERDKLLGHMFYHVATIEILADSSDQRDMALRIVWYTLLGLMKTILIMATDKFTALCSTGTMSRRQIIKTLAICSAVLIFDASIVIWAYFFIAPYAELDILIIFLFENLIIMIRGVKTILKYSLELKHFPPLPSNHTNDFDENEQQMLSVASEGSGMSERNPLQFTIDSVCDVFIFLLNLCHLLHLWWKYGNFLNILSLYFAFVAWVNLTSMLKTMHGYLSYRRVLIDISMRFPNATAEELADAERSSEPCAICRDKMLTAKKLPCGHLYHRSCLQQWAEHKRTCPQCRRPISSSSPESIRDSVQLNISNSASEFSVSSTTTATGRQSDSLEPELLESIQQLGITDRSSVIVSDAPLSMGIENELSFSSSSLPSESTDNSQFDTSESPARPLPHTSSFGSLSTAKFSEPRYNLRRRRESPRYH